MAPKNESCRIAHLTGKVCRGGIDTVVMEYYRNIDRRRFQFDFIMDGYDETPLDREIAALGGRVYKVEPYARNLYRNMKQCSAIFENNCYQIVHAHLNTLSVFPLAMAWRAKVPVRIAHSHSTAAPGEGGKTFFKYILRPYARLFATHYCACSAYAGKWLFGDKLDRTGKVKLSKNAVNLDKFAYNEQVRARLRRELELEQKFVVGHVGRFVYQKNHPFLVDIFHEVVRLKENTVLMLLGSGPSKDAIKKKVASLGLTDKVLFLGSRSDVPALMQAMDVFVFPSHYEGLGLVTIEAQAAGLKTIVSEAIPQEAQVTDLLTYCRLAQPPALWAQRVVNAYAGESPKRPDTREQLRQKGYDIIQAAGELEKWYMSLNANKFKAPNYYPRL